MKEFCYRIQKRLLCREIAAYLKHTEKGKERGELAKTALSIRKPELLPCED